MTIMGARLGGSYVPIPSPVPLRRVSDPDTDMVMLRGGRVTGTLFGLSVADTFALADFLMDKLEVTNRQYKAFVDGGGYTNRKWWDSTIVRGGKPIEWSEAMALFVDKTGRPGPALWEGGAAPNGMDDFPVGGVSWYEARAYARFAGKALPTVVEWNAAAMPEAARWVVPHGRYESAGPVRGGAASSVRPRGVYDVAGNVREWTDERARAGKPRATSSAADVTDPAYLFDEIYTQPELDRSPINGIRLVRRLGEAKDLARASAPIPGLQRDFRSVRPVDDDTYRGYLSLYDYDHTPLNATIVARDSTPPDWVREDIEFDLGGSAPRMWAVLLLPKRVRPPYQTVVHWPASDALILARPSKPFHAEYRFHRAQRPRRALSDLRAYVRTRDPDRRGSPRRDHRASRSGAALGEGTAPFDRLPRDSSRCRHDAARVRRHQLGLPNGRRDARGRAAVPRGGTQRRGAVRGADAAGGGPGEFPCRASTFPC